MWSRRRPTWEGSKSRSICATTRFTSIRLAPSMPEARSLWDHQAQERTVLLGAVDVPVAGRPRGRPRPRDGDLDGVGGVKVDDLHVLGRDAVELPHGAGAQGLA